jgi:hypothetical protein
MFNISLYLHNGSVDVNDLGIGSNCMLREPVPNRSSQPAILLNSSTMTLPGARTPGQSEQAAGAKSLLGGKPGAVNDIERSLPHGHSTTLDMVRMFALTWWSDASTAKDKKSLHLRDLVPVTATNSFISVHAADGTKVVLPRRPVATSLGREYFVPRSPRTSHSIRVDPGWQMDFCMLRPATGLHKRWVLRADQPLGRSSS